MLKAIPVQRLHLQQNKQTDKIKIAIEKTNQEIPSVNICLEDGTWSGLTFHGVPGGHEFTSFILVIYNVSGQL